MAQIPADRQHSGGHRIPTEHMGVVSTLVYLFHLLLSARVVSFLTKEDDVIHLDNDIRDLFMGNPGFQRVACHKIRGEGNQKID